MFRSQVCTIIVLKCLMLNSKALYIIVIFVMWGNLEKLTFKLIYFFFSRHVWHMCCVRKTLVRYYGNDRYKTVEYVKKGLSV